MNMRAKFEVRVVKPFKHFIPETGGYGPTEYVSLVFAAVTEKPFNADGVSEDNSFAQWTPTAKLEMTVTNPNLFDTFKPGQKYYLDFTEAVE
jgi:hypothetical protein